MTDLLYQSDSYCQEFSARVTEISTEPLGIVLDVTAFYPGGGGQPCDTGILSSNDREFVIEKTIKLGANIIHCVPQGTVLPEVGEHIDGRLNWERRYRLMRTHTAMHILCGVVFRDYGALVTGGDMEPLKGRMDFEFERMEKDLVTKIESAINQEVNKNLEVRVRLLPRAEAYQIPDLIRTKINLLPEGIQKVRIVEILGLDLQADGGTHVQFTSEVGPIRVVDYKSKGKINKRIYIEL
jgi:misacylated tRNA(Ala) deacylase